MFPLDHQSQSQPNAPALLFQNKIWTFRQLSFAVNDLTAWITSTFHHPIKIGYAAKTSDKYAIALYGGWKSGATVCPLPTNWNDEELLREIQKANFDLLLCDDFFVEFASLHTQLPVYRIDDLKFDSAPRSENAPENTQSSALEIFTSGSGGAPKRVHLSWQALENHAKMSETHLRYSSQDRWLVTLPLFHIGGVSTLIKSIVTGLSIHLEDGFDSNRVNNLLDTNSISILSLVPTTLQRLLDSRNQTHLPSSIKFVLLGGAPASTELLLRDSRYLASYGMSEAGSQITTVPPASDASIRVTSGLPLPGVKIEIRDAAGKRIADDSNGEIFVQSPALADGYSNDSTETENRFVDGWLRTGDYGGLTDVGALIVEGRREDRIVSGGENIHPAEIEQVLLSYPEVRRVFVTSIPDREWGQLISAVVESQQSLDENDLSSFVRKHIAPYKVPKLWWITTEIPHLPNGKPDRKTIINHFISNS